MKRYFLLIILIAIGCTNIQDAEPEQRNSFVYFYNNALNSISTASALDQDGGIVMIGYRTASLTDLTNPTMVVIKTDARGKTMWEKEFTDPATDSLFGKAIKPMADGYLVAADGINVATDPTTSTNTVQYNIHFYKMDLQGNVAFSWNNSFDEEANFFADAINTDAQGNVVLLSSKVRSGNNRSSMLTVFTPSTNGYQLTWAGDGFDPQTRNYTNGHAVQVNTANNIIWPSSITENATAKAYAAFPVVEQGSTYTNNNLFGATDAVNNVKVSDLQKNSFGFASIGTNYLITGASNTVDNNFFFIRLANNGSWIADSQKYYDGGVAVSDPTSSTIEDVGLALATASDGGYLLAGYLETQAASGSVAARGNGGKDILLVKVDAFGNVQWSTSYGGSGDEVINTAFQATDGGFIVTGTNTLQGFASMFVMKVNANGELTD